jgi:hypothetical protein
MAKDPYKQQNTVIRLEPQQQLDRQVWRFTVNGGWMSNEITLSEYVVQFRPNRRSGWRTTARYARWWDYAQGYGLTRIERGDVPVPTDVVREYLDRFLLEPVK